MDTHTMPKLDTDFLWARRFFLSALHPKETSRSLIQQRLEDVLLYKSPWLIHSCVGVHKIALLRMTQNPGVREDTLTSYLDRNQLKYRERGEGQDRTNRGPPSRRPQCASFQSGKLPGLGWSWSSLRTRGSCPALKSPGSRWNRFLSQLDPWLMTQWSCLFRPDRPARPRLQEKQPLGLKIGLWMVRIFFLQA